MTENHNAPTTVKFLRLPSVENIVALRKSAIYAKVKDGTFPAPIKLSRRAVAWTETSIATWVNERIHAASKSQG